MVADGPRGYRSRAWQAAFACLHAHFLILLCSCAGLGGELRPANHIERRIMEAAKLGFSSVIVPAIHAPAASGRLAGIHIIKCRTIKDALQVSVPALLVI